MDWSHVVANCRQSCVLVQITGRDSLSKKGLGFPSSKSENGITTISGSGVIVDSKKGLIITSGAFIAPFLVHNDSTNLPKDNRTLLPGTAISILGSEKDSPIEPSWVDCRLAGVWSCESVSRCIYKFNSEFRYKLSTGWGNLTSSSSSSSSSTEDEPRGLSMLSVDFVAVLQINSSSISFTSASLSDSNNVALGQPVTVIGSPFGSISPTAFFNSVSSGIISHSFHGTRGSSDLLLTDARCLPGNEGGGVFNEKGKLIGLVAAHSNVEGKPLDLNFVIPINTIASLLASIDFTNEEIIATNETIIPANVRSAKHSVVNLQIGNSWASGIVVSDNGHILTNAHLFKSCIHELQRTTPIPTQEYNNLRVKVYFSLPNDPASAINQPNSPTTKTATQSIQTTITRKGCESARVIYLSHTHLDVALLQIVIVGDTKFHQFLKPAKTRISVTQQIGMPVWLVAHGFSPDQGMDTICSYGNVANIILREGVPASLQTSASVHGGNSGGLLVNSDGELIGMVMSNTTHKSSRIFTRLNFAIPYQQFIALINFANGEDQLAIDRLQKLPTDNFLASLWNFKPEQVDRPKVGQNFRDFMEKMNLKIPNSKL